jgi:hypothetical protein
MSPTRELSSARTAPQCMPNMWPELWEGPTCALFGGIVVWSICAALGLWTTYLCSAGVPEGSGFHHPGGVKVCSQERKPLGFHHHGGVKVCSQGRKPLGTVRHQLSEPQRGGRCMDGEMRYSQMYRSSNGISWRRRNSRNSS